MTGESHGGAEVQSLRRRFVLSGSLLRRLVLPICFLILILVFAWLAARYTSLEVLLESEDELRSAIKAFPLAALAMGLAVYAAVSLVPGLTGKSIVFGWLFGLWPAVCIVNLGMTLAGVVSFAAARWLLREAIQDRWGDSLEPVRRRMEADGVWYLLALRFMHAPYNLTNYSAGAMTDIDARTFWWTTQLGLLPGNIIFVYAGARLPTLKYLVEVGPWGVVDGPMIAALLSSIAIPAMTRLLFRSAGRTLQRRQSSP